MNALSIDLETFSELDIKAVGTYRYAEHPSTEILMMAYAIDDFAPHVWLPDCEPMPWDLLAAISGDCTIHAFNAQFERAMLAAKLPSVYSLIHPWRWRCTQVEAYALSFTGGLDDVVAQIGLPYAKDPAGKRLIERFSKPQPRTHKVSRWTRHNDPVGFEAFKNYCAQDVVVERAVRNWCARRYNLTPVEIHHTMIVDPVINERGIRIDEELVEAAIAMRDNEFDRLDQEIRILTGVRSANAVAQLREWMLSRGVKTNDLRAETVRELLTVDGIDANVRRFLELRQQRGLSSLAKYDALHRATCDDGRLRGVLQTRGASRTGRYAGRIFQPQNLPRGAAGDTDKLADAVRVGTRDAVMQYAPVCEALSDLVRGTVIPTSPDFQVLVVADYSSIESRVLGWLVECARINNTFRDGRDTYKDFATVVYRCAYDAVTKAQRTFCKPPVLGCFAEGTEVLTRRGWVEIQNVTGSDEVYDGHSFVGCDGSQFMGVKQCIEMSGILVTPEHRILTAYGWVEAWRVSTERRWLRSATRLASGSLSGIRNAARNVPTSAAALAEKKRRISVRTLSAAGVDPAFRARTLGFRPVKALCKKLLALTLRMSKDYPTVTTPSALEQLGREGMYGTGCGASATLSAVQRRLSRTLSRSMGGTTPHSTSTASTTMATMPSAMSGSSPALKTTATSAATVLSITTAESTAQRIFTAKWCRSIAARLQCVARFVKEKVQPRLLQGLRVAEVNTYDIVNAGEGERYMIRSPQGELFIVHNCGYRLGGAGLVKYAHGMGVVMTEDEASRMVALYRETHPEVPRFWYWIERAVAAAMQDTGLVVTGYRMQIWRDECFLYIKLPSGRKLTYYQPEMRSGMVSWDADKVTFTFMGQNSRTKQWERLAAHGGVLTENIVQAIAYDILVTGINRCHQKGLDIVLHVHDEIVVEAARDEAEATLSLMIEEMSRPPLWAQDMLMGAAGFICNRYQKD